VEIGTRGSLERIPPGYCVVDFLKEKKSI
jgi:hypothetical protein